MSELARRLEAALAVLGGAHDVLRARVETPEPPAWCVERGWGDFLLGLDEASLERAEAEGLGAWARDLPASLRDLVTAAAEVTRLPALASREAEALADVRHVRARKRPQLAALLAACGSFAMRARRVVDVGSGQGHFVRLASRQLGREALGIERDGARVEAARLLAERAGVPAVFVEGDVLSSPPELAEGDVVVGLHACGELGDALARAAAPRALGVVLVGCCAQKIRGPVRRALSETARGRLELPREALGLANLAPRAMGVETSVGETMLARGRRHALRKLLAARGLVLGSGDEMHGLNRRHAHRPLSELAARCLARRGLAPASAAELALHERVAAAEFGAMRRLSLARNLLARPLEVTIALDRARYLEEQGLAARVATVFDAGESPRNVAVLAERPLAPP